MFLRTDDSFTVFGSSFVLVDHSCILVCSLFLRTKKEFKAFLFLLANVFQLSLIYLFHLFQDNSLGTKPFSDSIYSIADVGIDKGWVNAADGEDNFSIFRKSMEGFQSRDRILADKLEGFSLVVDEFIASLLRKSKATEDGVIVLFEHIESLKQKTRNLEISKQEQEATIWMLRNDVTTLLSVCTDATRELHFDVKNNLLELSHVPELERLDHSLFLEMRESEGDATVAQQQRLDGGKHVEAADKLLFVTRKVQALIKQFESSNNMAAATIEELLDKLKESRKDFEKAVEERDQNHNRVSKLETDVEALQNSCSQMRHKLMDYQNKEGELNKREEEVSSLYNSLLVKEQGKHLARETDFVLSLVSVNFFLTCL